MSGFTYPEVLGLLRCPHCAGRGHDEALRGAVDKGPLRSVACQRGHNFDVSRQGHLNLLAGRASGLGDTATMVQHRLNVFDAGHFEPLASALATLSLELPPGPVVDVGAGPGYYLAHLLEASDRYGLALDVSVAAAKRAGRAHGRLGSVVADTRNRLPVGDQTASIVLDVFAPRHAAEFRRVLGPDGNLVVVTPAAVHLKHLLDRVATVQVDPAKRDRLHESLSADFTLADSISLTWPLELTRLQAAELLAMGPTGHHRSVDQIAERLSASEATEAAVDITLWRPT